jgi:hypothetical protein
MIRKLVVFETSLEVDPSVATNLDDFAAALGTDPCDALLRTLEVIFHQNLFAKLLETPTPKPVTPAPLGDRRFRENKNKPTPKLTCSSCGGPRSIYSARQCRVCYTASLKTGRATQQSACSTCGKPCSYLSRQCRACYTAKSEIHEPPTNPPVLVQPVPSTPAEPPPLSSLYPKSLRPTPATKRHPQGVPEFSPEFLEKLKRVAAGAPIFELHSPVDQEIQDKINPHKRLP